MSGSASLHRYFYRACQSTLFPSPVQVGRQLDKIPTETRRNILSHDPVRAGSPLSPNPPFLSLAKPPHKTDQSGFPNARTSQGPVLQTGGRSEQGLCTLEGDTLPYTKDVPSPKVPECLDKTLEAADQRPPSWLTSTPLPAQTDSVQLEMPADGDSRCVKYTRSSESDHAVRPAPRTEQAAERLLHTPL